MQDLPNIHNNAFAIPDPELLHRPMPTHRPRILLLYGSLRERSFSRFATVEAARRRAASTTWQRSAKQQVVH